MMVDPSFTFGGFIDPPLGSVEGNPRFYNTAQGASLVILQRVWDTVNLEWCYYSKTIIDPSPTPSETSPAHSGSITSHSIIDEQSEKRED